MQKFSVKILSKIVSVISIFLVFAGASGFQGCNVSEYCKKEYASDRIDQNECSRFCRKNKNFNELDSLKEACVIGQMVYLNSSKSNLGETLEACSQNFENRKDEAEACKIGASAEFERYAKYKKSFGTSVDRETGN